MTAEPEEKTYEDRLSLDVSGVTKSFGPIKAVNNVTFNVRKGEVVGFLGPNGSGKTTTMRLLTSFYTPDSGTILIEGIDNQKQDVETRRKIGYLPENNPLYGDMLVNEYLKFVAQLRGTPHKELNSNLEMAVTETGIEAVYYRPISHCSKGYKQRVGLAQAILHRPNILIMDEPTEGLDPNQRVPIRELIRSVGKDRTVLLSTHVLQEVEETCDRLLIISQGDIKAQGTLEELQGRAQSERYIHLEVEGENIESSLRQLDGVDSVDKRERINGRKRYILSVLSGKAIQPEIFNLAKQQNWVIWELHQETPRLSDLFHSLTSDDQNQER